MTEIVTLELPEMLTRQVKEVAAVTHRSLEDLLIDWLERVLTDLPIESLPDAQVLAFCEMQMPPDQQELLHVLLTRNREGQLSKSEARTLDDLMQVYRHGLVRKARAWKVAVERGLKAPLN